MTTFRNVMRAVIVSYTAGFGAVGSGAQAQETVTIQLSITNHRFQPAEIKAPADKPIKLQIKNFDATPAEFESVTLRVEKVIAGNSEGVINLRPLKPGVYKFFDDFNKATTQGTLVVQ